MGVSDKAPVEKPVDWMGSSKKDFLTFPDEVKDEMGFALYQAQVGDKHVSAKPLKGFASPPSLEKAVIQCSSSWPFWFAS